MPLDPWEKELYKCLIIISNKQKRLRSCEYFKELPNHCFKSIFSPGHLTSDFFMQNVIRTNFQFLKSFQSQCSNKALRFFAGHGCYHLSVPNGPY